MRGPISAGSTVSITAEQFDIGVIITVGHLNSLTSVRTKRLYWTRTVAINCGDHEKHKLIQDSLRSIRRNECVFYGLGLAFNIGRQLLQAISPFIFVCPFTVLLSSIRFIALYFAFSVNSIRVWLRFHHQLMTCLPVLKRSLWLRVYYEMGQL